MSTQGRHGRGYVLSCQDSLHPRMVVAISLSKCFGMGCGGALLFPNREWRGHVQSCGATMIFSGPIPPPMLGAGIASARIHLSPEIAALQGELAARIKLFRQAAARKGIELLSSERSPVQYVLVGELEQDRMLAVARAVMDDGFFISCCGYPAVAKNHSGLRLTLSRHVSEADIHAVLDSIRRAMTGVRGVADPACRAAERPDGFPGNLDHDTAVILVTERLSGSPSPPYSGERGWGEGARLPPKKTPHPQPLSPEYRGEGSLPGASHPCKVFRRPPFPVFVGCNSGVRGQVVTVDRGATFLDDLCWISRRRADLGL